MLENLTPTAGELVQKIKHDNTNYLAREVGEAIVDNTHAELIKCIEIHNKIFDEDEYCLVIQYARDPLIKEAVRKKFWASLYLPKPRPDQAVFLYNKRADVITKRLWVLPNAVLMAKLASVAVVPEEYKTMQAWSVAFYAGAFWEYIRYEHNLSMLSEQEYISANREKLIEAGCKIPTPDITEAFDFSKVNVKKIVNSQNALID
jgi:hypothetical protein